MQRDRSMAEGQAGKEDGRHENHGGAQEEVNKNAQYFFRKKPLLFFLRGGIDGKWRKARNSPKVRRRAWRDTSRPATPRTGEGVATHRYLSQDVCSFPTGQSVISSPSAFQNDDNEDDEDQGDDDDLISMHAARLGAKVHLLGDSKTACVHLGPATASNLILDDSSPCSRPIEVEGPVDRTDFCVAGRGVLVLKLKRPVSEKYLKAHLQVQCRFDGEPCGSA